MGVLLAKIASVVLLALSTLLSFVLYFYGPRWGIGILTLVVITVLVCLHSPIGDLTTHRAANGGGGGVLPVQVQQQPPAVPEATQRGGGVNGGGLDASTIAALPAYAYGKKKANAGDDDCAVCLGELQLGEAVKQLPACAHLFHDGCIDAWLRSHVTCPVCRFPVADTALPPAVFEIAVPIQ